MRSMFVANNKDEGVRVHSPHGIGFHVHRDTENRDLQAQDRHLAVQIQPCH